MVNNWKKKLIMNQEKEIIQKKLINNEQDSY